MGTCLSSGAFKSAYRAGALSQYRGTSVFEVVKALQAAFVLRIMLSEEYNLK